MKSLIATGLVLCAGIVGSLAPATSAQATQNFHGNICQPTNPSDVNRLFYAGAGTEALSAAKVSCALFTDGKNIKSIEVNVRRTDLPTTFCSISAVDWNGNTPATIAFSIPAGQQYNIATVPNYAKGVYFSYAVSCGLPTGQVLTSINVYTP
ncbi:MAG: hypothetical protein ACREYF_12310 [Gammaproteobacteria bacterium]